jgi:hypothetical protein
MAAEAPLLRPLGIGDVLDELFVVYRRGLRTFLGIAAVVQVPFALLSLPFYGLAEYFGERATRGADVIALLETQGGPMVAWAAVSMGAGLASTLLMLAAVCQATSHLYLGGQSGVWEAYRLALGRFWPVCRLALLAAGILGGLVVLVLLPALVPVLLCVSLPAGVILVTYLVVEWSLAWPALVLEERRSALWALGRSRALVHGAWWRTLALLTLLGVLTGVFELVVYLLADAVVSLVQAVTVPGEQARPAWLAAFGGLLHSLAGIVYAPLFYIGLTLVYYDRRIRAEAFDLTVRARALADAAPPDAHDS